MSARDLEVDIAFTLLACPDVASVLTFDDARGDEYRFAIAMNTYSVGGMVAAHYAMLSTANREATCPVLYYA